MVEYRKTRKKKGLVLVFTGNGKGKTTAAVGMAVRAAGSKQRVLIVQFIKGKWKTGEETSLKALAPYIELVRMGRGFTVEHLRDKRVGEDEHQAAAQEALAFARSRMLEGDYHHVILDEIMGAIKAGLVSVEDVVNLIKEKPANLHLTLTGRNAPPEIVDLADLVSEIHPVKHPFQAGISAQRGVEF